MTGSDERDFFVKVFDLVVVKGVTLDAALEYCRRTADNDSTTDVQSRERADPPDSL